ncbi:MAG: lipocalin family protein [Cyclobacteriaceae bacterium]
MKTRVTAGLFALLAAFSCNDDDEQLAPIEGKWRGTMAEIQVKPFGLPIPVSKKDESFHTEIEFRSDGKLIVYEDSQTTEGTWKLNGNKLVTDIDFNTEFIGLSGTYTVERLTGTTLIFYLEKDNQTISDPDTGQSISGDLKATLHFQKI